MLVNKQTINLLEKEPETTGNKTNTPTQSYLARCN